MEKKKISIALQGGGAHGAFSWGVIDKLLEDGRFDILGASGTSAGGMNCAALIQGLIEGGNDCARKKLEDYWKKTSELGEKISPFRATETFNLDKTFGYIFSKQLQSYFSPYQTNPLNLNPFKDFIRHFFNFGIIRAEKKRRLFLGTTHVKSGKIRIFSNQDISSDVLMASACLPFLFQAVEIDGEHYWDGGYIANPAIYPLIYNCDAKDVLIVQLTNSQIDTVPKTVPEIVDRMKEITYNGCLLHEMRAIYFITKLIDEGKIQDPTMKRLNMHVIKFEQTAKTGKLNLSSALNTNWDFLRILYEEGRHAAEKWIERNFDKVGSNQYKIDEEAFSGFIS